MTFEFNPADEDEHGECRHEIETLQAKLDGIFKLFRNSVPLQNVLRERRNIAFQMQGQYDGSMSDDCKSQFAEEYRVLLELIEKLEGLSPVHSDGS